MGCGGDGLGQWSIPEMLVGCRFSQGLWSRSGKTSHTVSHSYLMTCFTPTDNIVSVSAWKGEVSDCGRGAY